MNWKVHFLIRIVAFFDPDRGSHLPPTPPPPRPKGLEWIVDRTPTDPPPPRHLVPKAPQAGVPQDPLFGYIQDQMNMLQ